MINCSFALRRAEILNIGLNRPYAETPSYGALVVLPHIKREQSYELGWRIFQSQRILFQYCN